MRKRLLGPETMAAALLLAASAAARADDQDPARLKSDIDALIARIAPSTKGMVRWVGSDPIAVRREGGALVAEIDHAHLAVGGGDLRLALIKIRESGPKPGEKTRALAIALPSAAEFRQPDGTQTTLRLDNGTANFVLDAGNRVQDEQIGFDHLRIAQDKSGLAVAAGQLTVGWKMVPAADGSWQAPVDFELKAITFQFPPLSADGGIERIAYHGAAAGPHLATLEKLRDTVAAMQTGDQKQQQAGLAALLALLPEVPATFSKLGGEARLDGLKVRDPNGATIVSLAQLDSKSEVTGLAGASAGMRLTLHYDGLDIAPRLVPESAQPHRVVFDVGITDIDSAVLRELLGAVGKMAPDGKPSSPSPEAMAQLMGTATRLTPAFHAYDVAVDTRDVGLDLTGATKGSPLSPQGYEAAGDLVVRGFDAVPQLGVGSPVSDYLPVLRQIGTADPATGKVKFHLASTPQRQITINGNDVHGWFSDDPAVLRPAGPPGPADYVRRVQQALAAAGIEVPASGRYDAATAGAVARYQKQQGINISGVLDPPTREKLGLPAPPPVPERQN